jgi:hypothetical protein
MKNERQAVIPTSGPTTLDTAMYAEGRKHGGNPPAKLGVPQGNLGMGRRGADQPKQTVKYTRHNG